jgi:hypothetical protein
VNVGDYPTAVAQTVRDESPEEFAAQVASSQDTGFSLGSVREEGGHVVVWLTFTSRQEAGRGPGSRPQETCTDWSLDYVMTRHSGLWLIDSSGAHGDDDPDAPCADPDAGESGDG